MLIYILYIMWIYIYICLCVYIFIFIYFYLDIPKSQVLKSTSFKPQNTPTKFPREILEHPIHFPDNKTVKSRSLWCFGSFDVAPFQAPTPAVTPPVTARLGIKNCVPRTKFCPNFCDHPKWRRFHQQHRWATCPKWNVSLFTRNKCTKPKIVTKMQANHDFQILESPLPLLSLFFGASKDYFLQKTISDDFSSPWASHLTKLSMSKVLFFNCSRTS